MNFDNNKKLKFYLLTALSTADAFNGAQKTIQVGKHDEHM
jgi:hypothetical protein